VQNCYATDSEGNSRFEPKVGYEAEKVWNNRFKFFRLHVRFQDLQVLYKYLLYLVHVVAKNLKRHALRGLVIWIHLPLLRNRNEHLTDQAGIRKGSDETLCLWLACESLVGEL
jgi:hypothetical protein